MEVDGNGQVNSEELVKFVFENFYIEVFKDVD